MPPARRRAPSAALQLLLGLLAAFGFLAGAQIIHPLSHAHDGHSHEGSGTLEQCAKCITGDEPTPDIDARALLGPIAPTGARLWAARAAVPDAAATLPQSPRAPPAAC